MVSTLTSLIWYFEADAVARMKLFYEASLSSTRVTEVAAAVDTARQQAGEKPYEPIPV